MLAEIHGLLKGSLISHLIDYLRSLAIFLEFWDRNWFSYLTLQFVKLGGSLHSLYILSNVTLLYIKIISTEPVYCPMAFPCYSVATSKDILLTRRRQGIGFNPSESQVPLFNHLWFDWKTSYILIIWSPNEGHIHNIYTYSNVSTKAFIQKCLWQHCLYEKDWNQSKGPLIEDRLHNLLKGT